MIRVAICDDEITSLELLYRLVKEYLQTTEEEFHVRRFLAVYDLLECIENPNIYFDLYLLDVIMPMYSGIEVGRMIRDVDEFAMIVYTTAWDQYALDAISTAPLHYLIKPIDPEAVHKVLDAALRRIGKTAGQNLLIRRKEGFQNVGLHRIEYVEYRNHALMFHMCDGAEIASRVIQESFSSMAKRMFSDARFVKPHASYVVNMDHVAAINAREFVMSSGACVPISKRIYSSVKTAFLDYMVEENGAIVI